MATAQNSKKSPTGAGGENPIEMNPEERDRILRRLRRFHVTGPIPDGAEQAPSADYAPALLVPLRQSEEIHNDYPLFLFSEPQGVDETLCAPMDRFLGDLLEKINAEGKETPLLKKNLTGIAKSLRRLLATESKPAPAVEFLSRAAALLSRDLKLEDETLMAFRSEVAGLSDTLPAGGHFLGFSSQAPIHLFVSSVRVIRRGSQERFRGEIAGLLKKVRALLAVDQSKAPVSREADGLRNKVGGTGEKLINPEEMSRVIGMQRGSGTMDDAGRERMEGIVKVFEEYVATESSPMVHVVHDKSFDTSALGNAADCVLERGDDPCGDAHKRFDRLAVERLPLFKAIRIAELEIEKKYYPPHHDAWFDGFSAATLSAEELKKLPQVVAVDSADRIAREGLLSLSRLLRSGSPVHVIVPIRPGQNPGEEAAAPTGVGYRLEIGYLGISQREAWVDQSSAARPDHLMQSYSQSLRGTRTALHIHASGLDRDGHAPRLNTWLHAGVELGGRAHAFFRFNPEAGATWAERFEFEGNPQADRDWPEYALSVKDDSGDESEATLPFTFADFALLEKEYSVHFHLIPDPVRDKMLVDTGTYLAMDRSAREEHIPFVYAMDGHGGQTRFAVTRRLAEICRDRLSFWKTIQELAGEQNQYARKAAEKAREEAISEGVAEKEALHDSYDEKLHSMREEIAEGMIEGLVGTLIRGEPYDVKSAVSIVAGQPGKMEPPGEVPAEAQTAAVEAEAEPAPVEAVAEVPAKAEEPAAPPVEEAPVAAEEEDQEDPWVDTAECTSCNECLNINDALFVYDDDDKCEIGDPKAGTYDELVRAAESCPVGIIHPGTPLNPNEPNLEELKKRAEAFR